MLLTGLLMWVQANSNNSAAARPPSPTPEAKEEAEVYFAVFGQSVTLFSISLCWSVNHKES